MYLKYLVNGMVVGFSASIPLGPIGVLCIQKTINKGRISGFMSGMGAATADTIYAIIAGFGLSFIANFIVSQQLILRIIGAAILFYLGIRIFRTNPAIQLRREGKKSKNILADYFSILFLTLSNPLTIFLFGAVFAGFGIIEDNADFKSVLLLVCGVFIGALTWWTLLTGVVNLFRSKFRLKRIWWINKITGVLIMVFSIAALVSVFFLKA
ncbi:MAG: lysine transporter LysE [Bacteroidetes bacterium RIFOXYA12_FULL_35_11]|nr:MAG: lysine transporter LysE [Bacteroidetes bacterium GWF2_35_48]OFY81684.1 MAG: lysine transporter LysE [Bacteroidetes bacterium RIFOXYA12_FULL_35_11]OFY93679.1 MAG: lysine transporter LysE [Bacteroidetes bacterium RIFOXYC12_FULL_35_7]OFY96389.1 MAG: lysine transporter LysE [Bacteroidetes bacterium RIFOXYB2_FULL_35_7]HBX50257.1 lysine transporter LysE [Bacteroidales bacterium]